MDFSAVQQQKEGSKEQETEKEESALAQKPATILGTWTIVDLG
jgi:hypothetical protein